MALLDVTLFFVQNKILIGKIIKRTLLYGLTAAGVTTLVIGLIIKNGDMALLSGFGLAIVWIIAGRMRISRYRAEMEEKGPLERKKYRRWP
jgi:hypothetical protein